jgi:glucoamylase
LDLVACGGRFVLALGFGPDSSEAAHRVRAALLDDGEAVREQYARGWRDWQATIATTRPPGAGRDLSRISAVVLRTSESKTIPGAIVASLSTPWGLVRGGPGDATEGYQLVWPRDLCEAAGGYLAVGATSEAVRVARYLRSTQEADGHWTQNMQPDGVDYWLGIQVGETAFPIGLLDHLRREAAIRDAEIAGFRLMVRQAARYIVRAGPSTHQDRWENQEGYTPFTLSLVIASLLVAADMADEEGGGESEAGVYLRETADAWNAAIESWLYVTGTDLARRVGVAGYYVRIVPPGFADSTPRFGRLRFSGDPPLVNGVPVTEMVSPDALALVRFGLRRPDDPKILDTIKVIDAVLKTDLPTGPAWRRYNGDQYGEHADGSPYRTDNHGIGRSWPLLTGERGHYELQAGRPDEALRLLHVMEAQAGDTGLIPEQIWDADDVPEKALFRGRPSGSAMPLVWAHAEYLKLCRSLHDGRICDLPPQTVRRYLEEKTGSNLAIWRFDQQRRSISSGEVLRIEVLNAATVRWSTNDWKTSRDAPTRETPLGIHLLDLPTGRLKAGRTIRFTFHWKAPDHWEGTDFEVHVI